jgi:hypothetical protein
MEFDLYETNTSRLIIYAPVSSSPALYGCSYKQTVKIDWAKPLFDLGQIIMTCGIYGEIRKNAEFGLFVADCIQQHQAGIWGVVCEEDKKLNDDALINGWRLLSSYEIPDVHNGNVWIITEKDRSSTTVLFPDEY